MVEGKTSECYKRLIRPGLLSRGLFTLFHLYLALKLWLYFLNQKRPTAEERGLSCLLPQTGSAESSHGAAQGILGASAKSLRVNGRKESLEMPEQPLKAGRTDLGVKKN